MGKGKRDYFPMFFKYRESLADLTDEQVGKVVRAAIDYAADGKEPKLRAVENMAFAFIRGDIDRARIAYEERCEANRRNAEKRWSEDDANASEGTDTMRSDANDAKQNKQNKQNKQSPSGERTRARAREDGKTGIDGEGGNGFAAPSAEDVNAYCKAAGLTLDAERFVDHYAAVGWIINGNPVRDWKALARKWAKEDAKRAEQAAAEQGPVGSFGGGSFDEDEFMLAALKRTYGEIPAE